MSAPLLQVEVVSREGRLWHGVSTQVIIPAEDGHLGILPHRQPLLAALGAGTVEIDTPDEGRRTFRVESGFVSVDLDFVTVVADHGSVA